MAVVDINEATLAKNKLLVRWVLIKKLGAIASDSSIYFVIKAEVKTISISF